MQAASTSPAPRFSLSLPMRYRLVGHVNWKAAKTLNVSASGLLFTAADKLPVGAKLEVEISMTAAMLKPTHLRATSEVLRQGTKDQPMITTVRHVTSQTVAGDMPQE